MRSEYHERVEQRPGRADKLVSCGESFVGKKKKFVEEYTYRVSSSHLVFVLISPQGTA